MACSGKAIDSVLSPLFVKHLKQGLVQRVSVVRIFRSVGEKVRADVEVAWDPHSLQGEPASKLCVKGLQREMLQVGVGGPTRDILTPYFATNGERKDYATEDEDTSEVVEDNVVGTAS